MFINDFNLLLLINWLSCDFHFPFRYWCLNQFCFFLLWRVAITRLTRCPPIISCIKCSRQPPLVKLIYKSEETIQSINYPYHSYHMGRIDLFGWFIYNMLAGAEIIGSLLSSLHKRRVVNLPALLQTIINSFRWAKQVIQPLWFL